MKHSTPHYLLYPTHPITVALAGCGGTGSQVLTCLGRIDFALRGLGHPGLQVFAYDPDIVSPANIGRQLFAEADIDQNKATVLITRINRFFGLDWVAMPKAFDEHSESTNMIISCVDTIAARREIEQAWNDTSYVREYQKHYYWLDFGNSQHSGQAILGGTGLPHVFDLFPDFTDEGNDDGPSCSLAEALSKQDLFINSTLAQLGMDIIWRLIRHQGIDHHGLFLNLQTMKVNPISIHLSEEVF